MRRRRPTEEEAAARPVVAVWEYTVDPEAALAPADEYVMVSGDDMPDADAAAETLASVRRLVPERGGFSVAAWLDGKIVEYKAPLVVVPNHNGGAVTVAAWQPVETVVATCGAAVVRVSGRYGWEFRSVRGVKGLGATTTTLEPCGDSTFGIAVAADAATTRRRAVASKGRATKAARKRAEKEAAAAACEREYETRRRIRARVDAIDSAADAAESAAREDLIAKCGGGDVPWFFSRLGYGERMTLKLHDVVVGEDVLARPDVAAVLADAEAFVADEGVDRRGYLSGLVTRWMTFRAEASAARDAGEVGDVG